MSDRAPNALAATGASPPMPDMDALLRELAPEGPVLDPSRNPGGAFRQFYDGWVDRGGVIRGKPRHSVRQIKLWLGAENEVRSLETKLAGRTALRRQDAVKLLSLFLRRWQYHVSSDSYDAYPAAALDEFVERLADELYSTQSTGLLLPARYRQKSNEVNLASAERSSPKLQPNFALTQRSGYVIGQLFKESDALITISRERTLLGSQPARTMAAFRDTLQALHDIDLANQPHRILLWVVDIGGRNDSDPARLVLLNLETLATQFRSIALIDAERNRLLWSWLTERVVILVGSLSRSEIDCFYGAEDIRLPRLDMPWLHGDRLFLEGVPGRWLEPEALSPAFGRAPGDLWRSPTVTAHLKLAGWQLSHSPDVDKLRDLRYFFHGSIAQEVGPASGVLPDDDVRCYELGQPGWRWSDAFRLACAAAYGRLGLTNRVSQFDPLAALAQLRRHHFGVLTLREFCRLTDRLIDDP
jgi:hypothetical protein